METRSSLAMAMALVGVFLTISLAAAGSEGEPSDSSCLAFSTDEPLTSAEQTVNGIRCYAEEKYNAAHQWWNEAATASKDKWAQFNLGVLLSQEGQLQDARRATYWFRQAADQGFAPAQYNLGIRLSSGIGGKQDQVEALKYISAAAEQGLAEAQYELGLWYFRATVLPKDDFQSYVWLSSASNGGHDEAVNKLNSLSWALDAADIRAAKSLAENIYVNPPAR